MFFSIVVQHFISKLIARYDVLSNIIDGQMHNSSKAFYVEVKICWSKIA